MSKRYCPGRQQILRLDVSEVAQPDLHVLHTSKGFKNNATAPPSLQIKLKLLPNSRSQIQYAMPRIQAFVNVIASAWICFSDFNSTGQFLQDSVLPLHSKAPLWVYFSAFMHLFFYNGIFIIQSNWMFLLFYLLVDYEQG